MRLTAAGYQWNGPGTLQAIVTLLGEDDTPLFEDSVCLSKQGSRQRFARALLKRVPQLGGKDLEAQLLQILWNAKDQLQATKEETSSEQQAPSSLSQADKLVKLVDKNGVELFHTPTGSAYARIAVKDHFEIHRCRSQGFKQWLSRQLYLTESKTPNSDALNSAIIAIEGKAIFDGEEHKLHNRLAFHQGAIWYDLTDEAWRAVKISPEGWEIVNQPPILFCRYQHQRPQVEPIRGDGVRRLFDFVNLRHDAHSVLFAIYVVSCFIPDIPHPIMIMYGAQGAAKTTTMRFVSTLVDPSGEEMLMFPRDINELAQKLNHHWICFFDNVSWLSDWISDMLSRAVTGIGFSKRELYTDEGDVIFQIKRVIGLNGINIVATKPDLLDRSVLFELERISDDKRREEKQLLREFAQAKPTILGGIFDAVSKAMQNYPTVHSNALPRMADYGHWGAAIALGLGYSANDFFDAYRANIQSQNIEILTSNAIASTLLAFMESRDRYEGTPAELLDELDQEAERLKIKIKTKSWPKAPQVLTRRLNELKANLGEGGLEIETRSGAKVGGKWKRFIKIWKRENSPRPKSSENTVDTVASVALDSKPRVGKGNGIDENTVADSEVSLPNQPEGNGINQGATVSQKIPLPSSVAGESSQQIGRQRYNAGNGILHTLLEEGNSVVSQSLGMSSVETLEIWDREGRPVIHLGFGENCFDLAEMLESKSIKPEHLSAIAKWLKKTGGR